MDDKRRHDSPGKEWSGYLNGVRARASTTSDGTVVTMQFESGYPTDDERGFVAYEFDAEDAGSVFLLAERALLALRAKNNNP